MADPKNEENANDIAERKDIEEFLSGLEDDEHARLFGELLEAQVEKCEAMGWDRDGITAALLGTALKRLEEHHSTQFIAEWLGRVAFAMDHEGAGHA